MRVHALLSWFEEDPEWLSECIRSLDGLVDRVVALDGAYELFPGAAACSDIDQAAAIEEAAEAIGAECEVHRPRTVWEGGEVQKRATLFYRAEQEASPGDWYFVIDADEFVIREDGMRRALQDTGLDVAQVALAGAEMPNVWRGWVGDDDAIPSVSEGAIVSRHRRLFRAIPGLTLRKSHHTYVTPDDRVLWGWPGQVETFDLEVLLKHRTHLREESRMARAHAYYKHRDESGIER